MVAPFHSGKLCFRHVAGDAFASLAVRFMVSVYNRIFHMLIVAGHACIITLLLLEAVASTRCVAVQTFKLPCFYARAHHPERICIILSQIASVGIEIQIFECSEIEMVEVPVPGSEACSNRSSLGMTGCAQVITLFRRHCFGADDL